MNAFNNWNPHYDGNCQICDTVWVFELSFQKLSGKIYWLNSTTREYGEHCKFFHWGFDGTQWSLRKKCPYSVRIRENTDQNNSEYGHFSHWVFSLGGAKILAKTLSKYKKMLYILTLFGVTYKRNVTLTTIGDNLKSVL